MGEQNDEDISLAWLGVAYNFSSFLLVLSISDFGVFFCFFCLPVDEVVTICLHLRLSHILSVAFIIHARRVLFDTVYPSLSLTVFFALSAVCTATLNLLAFYCWLSSLYFVPRPVFEIVFFRKIFCVHKS